MNIIIRACFRKLLKNKVNLIINLLGLTIGMTAFLFIAFWIKSEKSFDKFWKGSDRIYRVELERTSGGDGIFRTAMNYNGAGTVLRNEIPEIEAATHLDKDIITVFTPQASIQNVNMFFTDSSFFKVFPIDLQPNDTRMIFSDIHGAIISRSLALKLFGETDPINHTFKLNEGWEFYVCAIFDNLPENSHIKFDLILQRKALLYYMRNFDYTTGMLDNSKLSSFADRDPYNQSEWRNTMGYTYIKLKPGCNIKQVETKYAKAIASSIKHINERNEEVRFSFQPCEAIHLNSNNNGEMFVNGSYFKVLAFTLIGLLILVTSLFNYINISIANSIKQSSIHGMRRILGEPQLHLFYEYFFEALVINTIAGAISFFVAIFILHDGALIGGFKIFPVSWSELIIVALFLIVVSTFVSSIQPFLIAWKKRVETHKKALSKNARLSVSREVLVVFQFGVSIFLIIGTLAIFKQIKFMQRQELGMDLDQTIVSYSPMTMIKKPALYTKLETFRNEVGKIPGVKGFTTSEIIAGKNFDRMSTEIHLAEGEENKTPFALANVDQNYFDFFAIQIREGSSFSPLTDFNSNEIVINEKAARQLGLAVPAEAIDRFVMIGDQSFKIVGVTGNFHHLSLKDEVGPVIFFKRLTWFRDVGYYFIKVSPDNIQYTIGAVKKLWKELYPGEDYLFTFLDERFNANYISEINFGNIYLVLSVLTIFIACMGLLAIANISAEARVKEIGIRKVNGAKISEILSLLNKDYMKWVAVALIIGTPVAWYAMHKWLESFAYKTNLSWWIFVLSGLLALGVALLTVSWQSWRAATRNPVEALRYE
jgi:putative ABC transport system permease protein